MIGESYYWMSDDELHRMAASWGVENRVKDLSSQALRDALRTIRTSDLGPVGETET